MANSTAKFSATVLIAFEDRRGNDCDCEVNVDYTFDGEDDLRILSSELLGPANISEWELDELIWEAAFDHALEAYPEWQAEYADYRREGMIDAGLLA
jgi:hypothetical protein